jgi:hypothetical protein
MAHDVFISYSSKDKNTADALCARLEQSGVRCWIAPRDVMPGSDWGAAIIDALEGSKVLMLVFTQNANTSPQIRNEVERAVSKGLIVLPVRFEQVIPSKSLEYFISSRHWLDALSPPLERQLDQVVNTTRQLLGMPPVRKVERGQADRPPTAPPPDESAAIPSGVVTATPLPPSSPPGAPPLPAPSSPSGPPRPAPFQPPPVSQPATPPPTWGTTMPPPGLRPNTPVKPAGGLGQLTGKHWAIIGGAGVVLLMLCCLAGYLAESDPAAPKDGPPKQSQGPGDPQPAPPGVTPNTRVADTPPLPSGTTPENAQPKPPGPSPLARATTTPPPAPEPAAVDDLVRNLRRLPGTWRDGSGEEFTFNADATAVYRGASMSYLASADSVTLSGAGGKVTIRYRFVDDDTLTVSMDGDTETLRRAKPAAAPAPAGNRVAGTWTDGVQTLELRPDGTAVYMGTSMPYTDTGSSLTFTGPGGVQMAWMYTLNADGSLTVMYAGDTFTLKRK